MIRQISSLCLQQNAPRQATLCARRNAEAPPPLPCFKVFIRAGRFLRSNEEGRLLSMRMSGRMKPPQSAAVSSSLTARAGKRDGRSWLKAARPRLARPPFTRRSGRSTSQDLSEAAASLIIEPSAASGACMNRNTAATTGMCCRRTAHRSLPRWPSHGGAAQAGTGNER